MFKCTLLFFVSISHELGRQLLDVDRIQVACTLKDRQTEDPANASVFILSSVKGRPHYYSTKREEYAQIRFDLDAGMSLSDLPMYATWNGV